MQNWLTVEPVNIYQASRVSILHDNRDLCIFIIFDVEDIRCIIFIKCVSNCYPFIYWLILLYWLMVPCFKMSTVCVDGILMYIR